MQAFETVTGVAIPLGLHNVDTDIIIPARFLKGISRSGMGAGAFYTLRFNADGTPRPESIFHQARYAAAPILLAGDNFGCGSSREHAPWALGDLGIRCVIAPSFSDIFAGNAGKNGILLVRLPMDAVNALLAVADSATVTVDLPAQTVTSDTGLAFGFEIDAFAKHCLTNGLDDIGLTEQELPAIAAFEEKMRRETPWV